MRQHAEIINNQPLNGFDREFERQLSVNVSVGRHARKLVIVNFSVTGVLMVAG